MSGVFDVAPEDVDNEFRRDDASAWDSMNHLRLVSALEEAFRIKFTMKEVGEMESFDDVRHRVAERFQAG